MATPSPDSGIALASRDLESDIGTPRLQVLGRDRYVHIRMEMEIRESVIGRRRHPERGVSQR
jgi:hypothetical protein